MSLSGASWVVRDCRGKVLMHSRRSYTFVMSNEAAELLAMHWAIESMSSMHKDKIIFESSCVQVRACLIGPCFNAEALQLTHQITAVAQGMQSWSLEHVLPQRNSLAQKIADSVTRELRLPSYISIGGPSWLRSLSDAEAGTSNLQL